MIQILQNYPHNLHDNMSKVLKQSRSIQEHTVSHSKILIYPVDQGFEHGPSASFASNPPAYDPEYHICFAIKAKMNAFAAPLGIIELAACKYADKIPMILKINGNTKISPMHNGDYDQAYTSSVEDAVRLGCCGIGLTIYPGSENFHDMLEKAAVNISKAKDRGLLTVVWAYPRGKNIDKVNELSKDNICYSAHIAALIGADIIKVKIPNDKGKLPAQVVRDVMQAAFDGKRIVLFSGGEKKDDLSLIEDATAVARGGGSGMIIGRNLFQRREDEALKLIEQIDIKWDNIHYAA